MTDGDLISREEIIIKAKEEAKGMEEPLKSNFAILVEWIVEKLPSAEKIDGDLIPRKSVITMLNKIENAVEDGDGFQFNEWIEYAKDIPTKPTEHILIPKNITRKELHKLIFGIYPPELDSPYMACSVERGCKNCKHKDDMNCDKTWWEAEYKFMEGEDE